MGFFSKFNRNSFTKKSVYIIVLNYNTKVQIIMQTNKIELTVDGMTCTGCASNVERYLTKKGLSDVYVNFSTKEVIFSKSKGLKIADIKQGINNLGFIVVEADMPTPFWTIEKKLTQ